MSDDACIVSREKRVPDTPENYASCACVGCPTYDQCTRSKKERLYCSRGTSGCKLTRLGCVCGECPVAMRFALSSNYYCSEGTAKF